MFVRGRGVGRVLVVSAALVAAAGCRTHDQPRTLPPLTGSPTPVASVSTTASPDPKTELAAAVAVVRRYFAAVNHLSADMNAAPLESLETNDCGCRVFANDVRREAQRHHRYFGIIRITSASPVRDQADLAEVLVTYNSTAGGTRDDSGRVLFRGHPRVGAEEMFTVRLISGVWKISDISVVKLGTTG